MELEKSCNEIVEWLKGELDKSGAKGFIVGNSGGIDSSVVLALCKRATNNVLGLIMPCGNIEQDEEDALLTAEKFDIDTVTIDLMETYKTLCSTIGYGLSDIAKSNIKPRLRMTTLYSVAQSLGYLVVGTGNRSEAYMGYFTKWGDGASDLNPIASMTKTEVYKLAKILEIPDEIINKAPSAGLWAGQTDEMEMGVSYREIDEYIKSGETNDKAAAIIKKQHDKTMHKRLPIKIYNSGDK